MIQQGKDFALDYSGFAKPIAPLQFIWVESGLVVMGRDSLFVLPVLEDDDDNRSLSHLPEFTTTISQGFWMSRQLIDQSQWYALSPSPQWIQQSGKSSLSDHPDWIWKDDFPMMWMTWIEAMKYCQTLNSRFNTCLPEGYHFSLPLETHWEYVCKANSRLLNSTDRIAIQDIVNKTNLYENDFGIVDMLGIMGQWCFDIASYYPSSSQLINFHEGGVTDWTGHQFPHNWFNRESYRVTRGTFSSVYREWAMATYGAIYDLPRVGLRVALRPITKWDLNDPLLKEESINLLMD